MTTLPQDDDDAPGRRAPEDGVTPATWAVVGLLLVFLYVLAVVMLQPGR